MRLKGTTQKLHHAVLTVLLLAGALPLAAQTPTPITSAAGLNSMTANGTYIITQDIVELKHFGATCAACAPLVGIELAAGIQVELLGGADGSIV